MLLIEHDMKVVMGVSERDHRARLRREDRRGHAGRGPGGRARDRGVPRQGRGRVSATTAARRRPRARRRPHLLRRDPRAQGRLARGRRGRDRDADRRERRRQVDDAPLDQRAQPPARRARSLPGAGHHERAAARRSSKMGIAQSPEGRRLFPRMTVTENLEMGAFQRTDKRELPGGHGPRLRALPAPRTSGGRRRPGRCPAASSRCARSAAR